MAYERKTWVTGETIKASDLNNMEQGIVDAQNDEIEPQVKQNTADIVELNSALTDIPKEFQYGRTSTLSVSAGAITEFDVTFPKAFSSTPQVFITCYSATTASTFGSNSWMVFNISTTGFTIRVANDESTGRSPAFNWLAIAG